MSKVLESGAEMTPLDVLRAVHSIAVVGASADRAKDSNDIMRVLMAAGYEVIPVNPFAKVAEIEGQTVYAALADVGRPVDMVDVFRPSAELYGIAQEAVAIGAKVLWGQLGIHDDAGVALAQDAGLRVVTNRCPKIELARGG